MKTVKTIRFQKDTINKQDWEIQINEFDGQYSLWKCHSHRETMKVIKQTENLVSKEYAEKYISDNSDYIIERYTRNFEPEYDAIFTNSKPTP